MTNAERQANHRARQTERLARRTAALKQIVELLPGPSGGTGKRIKQIAEEALK